MKNVLAYVLFIAIFYLQPEVFALHDFDILDFGAEEKETDSAGRVFFIITINIKNNHQPGKIVSKIIALNASGRVIKSQHMRGEFRANEVRTLSIRTSLEQGDYKEFDEWRLLETIKYETQ